MKKLICLLFMIACIAAIAVAPDRATAASVAGAVTGTGSGSFNGDARFGTVDIRSFVLGTGAFIEPDGSAAGVFHVVLAGRSALGTAQNITLEGDVTQGAISPTGGSFGGLASVDFGDGLPPVPGVPFNVDAKGGSIVMTIQSTSLPTGKLNNGGLTIE